MRIAILVTTTNENEFPNLAPLNGQEWIALFGSKCPQWTYDIYPVSKGVFPDNEADYDGWIIGTSGAMVHDTHAWIAPLRDLIKRIEKCKKPLFGAGFGHQIIALTLGGAVQNNTKGWCLGSIELESCARPPWMEAKRYWQYGAHQNHVSLLPKTAQPVLKYNDGTIAGFRVQEHIFATQTHPEFSHEFMRLYIEALGQRHPLKAVENARMSLSLSADNGLFSDCIIRFFEQAHTA